MSRRAIALVVLSLAAVVVIAACQDYNFNPVGACIIQPGSTQSPKLEDISTADILFVVDDSGSMDRMQNSLATNFSVFINKLNQTNSDRVSEGFQPFDFHIAVTNSSVFTANPTSNRCVLNGSSTECCAASSCTSTPSCVPGSDCGSGGKCVFSLSQATSEADYPPSFAFQCCTTITGCTSASCFPGDFCPKFNTSYGSGVAYPAGSFVGNPNVLHFTKNLYTSTPPDTATINALSSQFQTNIKVGTVGSSEEQHLEAGRLAMQKVLAGQYGSDFPHLGAKLVVIWVGDEDDCSSPNDPAKAIVLGHGTSTGNDECVADKNLPSNSPIPKRAFPISEYLSFFSGLVAPAGQAPSASQPYRSLSTAFINGSATCSNGIHTPTDYYLAPACVSPATPDFSYVNQSTCPSGTFGAGTAEISAAGVRFHQLATALRSAGKSVLEGSACDDFGKLLSGIADLVKAPSALQLSSQPASSDITVVRVIDADGNQAKICTPKANDTGSPIPMTCPQAAGAGWWFMDCGSPPNSDCGCVDDTACTQVGQACGTGKVCGALNKCCNPITPVASGTTQCIFINHTACELSPGQAYSAEYLGVVPPGGCSPASPTVAPSMQCAQALSGKGTSATADDAAHWWCYAPSGTTGTCLCQ